MLIQICSVLVLSCSLARLSKWESHPPSSYTCMETIFGLFAGTQHCCKQSPPRLITLHSPARSLEEQDFLFSTLSPFINTPIDLNITVPPQRDPSFCRQ